MQTNVIRMEKRSGSFAIPSVTVVPQRIRFNHAAAADYRINEAKYLDIFVDIESKLIGIKLLKDGNPEDHYAIASVMASPEAKHPIYSFSASKLPRLFGLNPSKNNWSATVFSVIPSKTEGVDFWIDMNEPLIKTTGKKLREINVEQKDFQTDTLVQSRFKAYTPKSSVSRTKVGIKRQVDAQDTVLNEPYARISKQLITFNKAAQQRFDLLKCKGVEVFVDTENNQLGLRFYKDKEPQCYTLTYHKVNRTVLFSWFGIATRLGMAKSNPAFQALKSCYVKILPPGEEPVDCILDMNELINQVSENGKTFNMKPIRSVKKPK